MAYLAPIHRGTSVRHAIKLNLLSADEESLVLAKANRLEVYNQTLDGLVLAHTRSLYGKVTMLERLRPANSSTEHLFVGTDRYMYFTISWDSSARQLRTEKSYQDQAEKTARDSQTEDRCLMDPTGRFMALLLYNGIVTIIPIHQPGKKKGAGEPGCLGDPVPARISDFFVRSSTFLHPRQEDMEQPKLAILYEDNQQNVCLNIRSLDYSAGGSGEPGSADLEKDIGRRDDLELGASHLIAVPAPAYGLLILAETSITYLDDANGDILSNDLEEATQFVAWAQVDNQRWLIADDSGKLYLFMLLLENGGDVTGWKLDAVGQTSRASVLVYLDGGYMFVGSHQGDSQVVKVQEQGIEVVQTISNIAPILDFTIMDMGNRSGEGQTNEYSSGQARIVTGSGAFQDGSLRSVRSGVGLEEQGLLGEMDHATDLFSLRSSDTSNNVDLLVVSFIDETRLFQFRPDGEVEEKTDFKSLSLSEGTLLAAGLSNGRILQVTPSSARLIESENGMVISEWSPSDDHPITAASANDQDLALSVQGLEALTLNLKEELTVRARRQFAEEGQLACIHVSQVSSDICIAGFWQSATVAILKIDTLETLQKIVVSDEAVSVPRSILLAQILFEQPPTLFIAMANGEVITFSVNLANFALSAKKLTVLGTQQANFKALPRSDGLTNVFATCEHPSLIYGSEGRIVFSAVTAEKASCICSFDSEAYPGAIAIATPEDVRIAVVDTERTTHVQTLPVAETVRRIAYSPKLRAFGLGTISRSLRNSQEVVRSHFKLADEVLFEKLDSYSLNEEELVESVIRADMREDSGDLVERFVVGTAYLDDEEPDSIRGRIIVFAVTSERKLKVITELPVKGACRALGVISGKIVAALVKTVVIYSLEDSHLHKRATYRTSTAPIDISIHGSQIAIADLMKSVSITSYTSGSVGLDDTLTETARHYQTAWGTAVAHVAEDTWLEADAEGNLMVLHQNTGGVTSDDRRRLEVTSEMRLGEMVNRIRSFEVSETDSRTPPPVTPKAFMGTVEGSIYLFGLIAPTHRDLLMRLQASLATMVSSLGDVPFNSYRAFRNQVRDAEEPYRFVDGELIEGFLDLKEGLQESVVGGLGEVGVKAGGLEDNEHHIWDRSVANNPKYAERCEWDEGPEVGLSSSADAGDAGNSRAAKAFEVTPPEQGSIPKMSLPGLDLSVPVESVVNPTIYELKEQTEWRFEVAFHSKVEVRLLSGTAELFGTELPIKQAYIFTGTKAAIYTWHGCRIEVVGDCQVDYIAEETPMMIYANLHYALEVLRDKASLEGTEGPRVLIVGSENAGKTSLVKILTAYATKVGRQPVVVNLDTKEGMLSVPGTLSATTFTSVIDVEHGWGSSPMSGPSQVPVKLPLVYYMGLANPEEKTLIYKPIVTRLALSVMNRLQDDSEAKETGVIIDTPGVISQGKGGYELIQHIVSELSVNVVVVLGSERLYSDMLRRFNGQKTGAGETIAVVKVDKSGGCVDRDEAYLQQYRQSQIREYFFGDANTTLSPHTQQIDFNQLIIYKLAEPIDDLLKSLMPGDVTEESTSAIFDKVRPSSQMQNAILAIVNAHPEDTQENIRDASVMGFIYIADVDEKKNKLKVLAPAGGRLPNKAMIWGSWPEGSSDLM